MRRLLLIAVALICSAPAHAQTANPLPTNSSEPLEITADKSLEWHRNEKQFIARVNTLAKQGPTSIAADILTADYRESQKSNMDIWRITAEGNEVLINSQTTTATGQKAVYDLDKSYAEMTGNNLKLVSPDQTVTARDRFEYWVNEGKLVAVGAAKVVRQQDTLEADQVSAIFADDGKGKRTLKSLEGDGNVTITTPTEVLTGKKVTYDAATNMAKLLGGATIKRGPNILQGERAEVNLATNVSSMFGGGAGTSKQVRGIFYPGSDKPAGAANAETKGSPASLLQTLPTSGKMTPQPK